MFVCVGMVSIISCRSLSAKFVRFKSIGSTFNFLDNRYRYHAPPGVNSQERGHRQGQGQSSYTSSPNQAGPIRLYSASGRADADAYIREVGSIQDRLVQRHGGNPFCHTGK